MNWRLTVAAALAFALVAGSASAAQPWLEDRRYGEGIGIRVGRFEFHPGVSAEFGYDSNFFQRASSGELENLPVRDAWRLRVTPSFTLSTFNARRARVAERAGATPLINFSANAYLAYSELFGNDEVAKQRRFDVGVGAKADIAPQRPFGADLYADFVRNGEPSNVADLTQSFDRGEARGGAGVSWRPGGGLFDWRLGYEATYSYFEDRPYTELQNLQHSILTHGRWRILPRSGFLYDARYTFLRYLKRDAPQPSGDSLQARLGFSGLVTNRIAFLIMGGWHSTFYEGQSATTVRNYDGYVGQAELKYFIMAQGGESAVTGLSSFTVGFLRDATNSYLGSFYTRDRGYVSFDYFLGGIIVTNVSGGFSHDSFPRANVENPSFTQNHIDATLFSEYRFSDTLGLNLTVSYDQSLDKGPNPAGFYVGTDPATLNPAYDNLQYQRVQAYLGLRLFW